MCWITGGHPPRRLLLPTDIEPTPSQNSASKVAGLQVHFTTPGSIRSVREICEVLKLGETQST